MSRRVVVTGVGLLCPVGIGTEEVWQAIQAGRNGIGKITCFDATSFACHIAGEVHGFDPGLYVEKKEIKKMGRFIHFGVAASEFALAASGLKVDESNEEQVGVYIGSGIGGFDVIEREYNEFLKHGPRRISPFFIPATIINLASGHVSIRTGAKGPNSAVATACTTGAHAIGDSFRIIQRGDADAMICGGAEACITPMGIGGFAAMRALSTRNTAPEEACRPWDKDRDGFVVGEGAGILILEELEFARRRGAPIVAEMVGYGMSSEFVNGQFFINAANAPPWGSELRLTRPNIGPFEDPFRGTGVANPFPVTFDQNAAFSPNGPFISFPSDLTTTRVHAYNVAFQRQIGDNTALSASYIGNYTTNLWDVVTGNPGGIPGGGAATGPCTLRLPTGGTQTFPNCSAAPLDLRREISQIDPVSGRFIGFLDYFTDTGRQRYNGMLLQIQRRAANGMSVNANYTLSKCEGRPSGGGGTANVASGYMTPVSIINPPSDSEAEERLDRDYGPCNTDRRHIVRLSGTVQSPQFDNAVLNILASDWRLSGSFSALSGSRLTIGTGIDRALTGNQGQQRANQVSDEVYGGTLDRYLIGAAFAQPALGTYGSSGRNAYEGPGSRNVDLSLVRAFRFLDSHRIEARVEAFNAFNWFRWGNPVTNLNNANFGRIQTASDPRIMQFAVKYQF